MARQSLKDLRRRAYIALEQGPVGERLGVLIDRLLLSLIVVNLIAVALESVPALNARYGVVFEAIEYVSLVVFTADYVLRLWAAVEHGPHRHLSATRARLKYALSPAGIVDLLAVLPFWFAALLPLDLRYICLLYTSPSPRDRQKSRMPSSA